MHSFNFSNFSLFKRVMNTTARYIFTVIGILLAGFILWYFKHIVAYILIALVLSLMGKPLVDVLRRLKIRTYKIPKALCAGLTLIVLLLLVFTFFRVFIPLIAENANELSKIDTETVLTSMEEPITRVEAWINTFKISSPESFSIDEFVAEKMIGIMDVSFLSNLFGSIASILGNVFIAIFAISFITFFFLKDDRMFAEGVLALIPDKHVEAVSHAMSSTKHLLTRYFIGIMGQISGIIILATAGLTIVGIDFRQSLLIGFTAGIFNVIPYLGPIIGTTLGVILGISTHLEMDFYKELLPLIGYMLIVFAIVQLVDNAVFQPNIFGKSVKAHPMEVFLLILISGSLAGITGMVLAIPSYTVIRVFAKEFLSKVKVVQKLTKKLE